MVPWGRLVGAGLLHQDMLVKKGRLAAAHQLAGEGGGRRAADHRLILRNAPPIAVITEEMTSVVGAGVDTVIGAGRGDITVQAGTQLIDPLGPEHLPEDHHPIASIGGHGLV